MCSKSSLLETHFKTHVAADAYEFLMAQDGPIPLSSWTKLKIPYYAPNDIVLPSIEQMDQAMDNNRINQNAWVCQVGNFAIKCDLTGHVVQEAETLLYLHENSSVRVPEVYAVFTSEHPDVGTVYYMVTEYINGITLSGEKILGMSPDSRSKLIVRLCDQIRLLRAIPAPGYYGHVHEQGWRPALSLIFGDNYTKVCGPYETYVDFAEAVSLTAEITAAVCSGDSPDFSPKQADALSAFRSTLASCTGQAPRFTHLDLQPRNIIATPVSVSSEEDAHDWQITLIDWADAGWYPAYMQAVALRERFHLNTTEPNMRERIEFCDAILKELGEESYAEVEKVFWDALVNLRFGIM